MSSLTRHPLGGALVGGALLLPVVALAAPPDLDDAELRLESFTAGDSRAEAVYATGDPGEPGFLVVWASNVSEGNDDSNDSVQARFLDGQGTPLAAQFQVNAYTTGVQRPGPPAISPDGSFVVVWGSDGSFGSDVGNGSIQMQRYRSDGTPVGIEMQVNSQFTGSPQQSPAAGFAPDGSLVVIWESSVGGGPLPADGRNVQGQRYASDGSMLASEFRVNDATPGVQDLPALSMAPNGGFVAAWEGDAPADYDGVAFRRFAAGGVPAGTDVQANTYTSSLQRSVALDHAPDGSFRVVWHSRGSDGGDPDESIQLRRFASDGSPLGPETQINVFTSSRQVAPSIAHGADGSHLVAWQSFESDGADTDGRSLRGRAFDALGAPLGAEFEVNTYTTGNPTAPSVARTAEGRFLVAWGGAYGPDDFAAVARVVRIPMPFFTDGFESGDLNAWDETIP